MMVLFFFYAFLGKGTAMRVCGIMDHVFRLNLDECNTSFLKLQLGSIEN